MGVNGNGSVFVEKKYGVGYNSDAERTNRESPLRTQSRKEKRYGKDDAMPG